MAGSSGGRIISYKRWQYWWAIWNALDDRRGAAASDALLLRVTLEALLATDRPARKLSKV
jgi:hypothetical protein